MLRHHVPPGTGADYSDNRYRHLHRAPVARGAHVFGAVAGKAVGLVVSGLAGAVALSRVLSNLLYETTPTDPSTFLAVSLVLLGVLSFGLIMLTQAA